MLITLAKQLHPELKLGETLTVAFRAKVILARLNLRAFLAAGLRASSGYKANSIAVEVNSRAPRDLASLATGPGQHRSRGDCSQHQYDVKKELGMQCPPMPALTRVEVDKKMAERAKANFMMVLEIWGDENVGAEG